MIKVILQHSTKYFSHSSITAVVGLAMTKYYTHAFSPAEFGILAIYLVMFRYIKALVSLNMDSGSSRVYFDYRENRRNEYLSTIFWFLLVAGVVVVMVGLLAMPFVVDWISPGTERMYLVTLFSGIGAVFLSFLSRVLYNEQKSSGVLKYGLWQTFVEHASAYVLISCFNLGILGRISGQGIGAGSNMIALLRYFYREKLFQLELTFNRVMAKETFTLALPGLITTFQALVFVYLDRIFLKHFIGDSAVGIYSLAFLLSQGLTLIFEAVSQAILPKVYTDMKVDYQKSLDELERFSIFYYAGLILLTVVFTTASPLLVWLVSNAEYKEASSVIPFILAGVMMGGFYKLPALVLGFHKKFWFYPILGFVSFGTNALLNWALIPKYGAIGAAFASFIGLFIYSTIVQAISRRYMSRMYNLAVIFVYLFIVVINVSLFLLVNY